MNFIFLAGANTGARVGACMIRDYLLLTAENRNAMQDNRVSYFTFGRGVRIFLARVMNDHSRAMKEPLVSFNSQSLVLPVSQYISTVLPTFESVERCGSPTTMTHSVLAATLFSGADERVARYRT